MNSDINKDKEKKKKKKEKKFHGKKGEITSKVQGDQKKGSILSKLDTLDEIVKKESRVVEETLRSGLIKSEQAEQEEEIEKEKLTVSEIRKKIDILQNLKHKNHSEGNYEKAIEISKKIIVLAFSNNLKSLVNEEKDFLEIVKSEVFQEPEKLRSTGVIKEELVNQNTIKEGVMLKLEEANTQEKSKVEEENLIFKKAKGDFEQERLVFQEEKEIFEQEKLKFEEKRENLKQERVRFEEEKQAFKWEKQMFEEIKKHEKEKDNDLRET